MTSCHIFLRRFEKELQQLKLFLGGAAVVQAPKGAKERTLTRAAQVKIKKATAPLTCLAQPMLLLCAGGETAQPCGQHVCLSDWMYNVMSSQLLFCVHKV